ncbi:hypothetical protein [Niabella hirudinis]|uniref:hypothetical protein n=1 Tax=Niabella hirudinis TaxID=1285929 RepID=UPI003EBFE13C
MQKNYSGFYRPDRRSGKMVIGMYTSGMMGLVQRQYESLVFNIVRGQEPVGATPLAA